MVVILMGVAGSGKTTIGRALAGAVGCRFVDADDFHSRDNITKMRRGLALSDADREPWLAALHALIACALERRETIVLACSALKERYRLRLADGLHTVRFVYLAAPEAALRDRLTNRTDHFARADLLESQLSTLEPPTNALVVDATRPIDEIVGGIRAQFGLR